MARVQRESLLEAPLHAPLIRKPAFVPPLERAVGRAVPLHPNVISLVKVALIVPLAHALAASAFVPAVLSLLAWFALDWLDGVVARETGRATKLGRVLDRATDYPLLVVVSAACLDVLPAPLVFAKLAVDGLLLVLYVLGRGSTENRVRTMLTGTTVVALLALSLGAWPLLVSAAVVKGLLVVGLVFSSAVALKNLGLLNKRFLADALSGANLLAGLGSAALAFLGRPDLSLVCLFASAVFDGLDGAAARRFGGTRLGVYADDVADAVSYGIAPGVALACALDGATGVWLGLGYAAFTIARLVYFTLRKGAGDPAAFEGAPSTVGALLVFTTLVAFPGDETLAAAVAGAACVLMVSFGSRYAHLGRWLQQHWSRAVVVTALAATALVTSGLALGAEGAAAVLFTGALVWALAPVARALAEAS
jgi:phosphatidylserine synthase